ncbi:hypothetical protein KC349_g270 [Hortaea werneckii]|nr:hypothetical protein KC349_g270 [Hortaea werneckii]
MAEALVCDPSFALIHGFDGQRAQSTRLATSEASTTQYATCVLGCDAKCRRALTIIASHCVVGKCTSRSTLPLIEASHCQYKASA